MYSRVGQRLSLLLYFEVLAEEVDHDYVDEAKKKHKISFNENIASYIYLWSNYISQFKSGSAKILFGVVNVW